VTQGDLNVSVLGGNQTQDREDQGEAMNGEKSDVGIVVRKSARKAAKADESA
jgi:hypothetical protein